MSQFALKLTPSTGYQELRQLSLCHQGAPGLVRKPDKWLMLQRIWRGQRQICAGEFEVQRRGEVKGVGPARTEGGVGGQGVGSVWAQGRRHPQFSV